MKKTTIALSTVALMQLSLNPSVSAEEVKVVDSSINEDIADDQLDQTEVESPESQENQEVEQGDTSKDEVDTEKDSQTEQSTIEGPDEASDKENEEVKDTQEEKKERIKEEPEEVVEEVIEENIQEDIQEIAPVMLRNTAVLQKGIRSPQVVQLKKDLAKLGFTVPGKGTNYFGADTEKKVKDFQRYYGLSIDGSVGPATSKKMDSVLKSPLQQGKRHANTIQLKRDLAKVGFKVPGNTTNYYGAQTTKQVKAFQKKHGLAESGIAEEITLQKLKSLVPEGYSKGDRDAGVKTLKANLKKLGFAVPGKGTTLYGADTEKKVKDFQRYYGLSVDGSAGPATLNKIKSILATPLQQGKRHKDTIQLKKNLAKVGFKVPGNTTNYYGAQTTKQVKSFQKKYGLAESGIAEEVTLQKLKSLVPEGYSKGDRDAGVKTLKANLKKLGFTVPGKGTTLYGADTEKKVREFQRYYGLSVDGIAGTTTLNKIKSILATPLQQGKRHKDTIQLKKDLAKVGFTVSGNTTNYYGAQTTKQVKAFQKKFGLVQNGIADAVTLAKLKQEASKVGGEKTTYTQYASTLNTALDKQMATSLPPQTDKYKNSPAYVHKNYLRYIALMTSNSGNLRTEASTKSKAAYTKVKKNTKLEIVKKVTGESYKNSKDWYEVVYKGKTVYAHSSIIEPSTTLAKTTDVLNVRSQQSASSHSYGQFKKGEEVTVVNNSGTFVQVKFPAWRNATRADTLQYLDPNKNDKFQHLVLTSSVGVTAAQLNKIVTGAGVLAGKGQAFIDAGKQHKVNEVYLISHAKLETGNGTSELSNGVEVGKNKDGKLVLVTKDNRKNLTAIKKTYNMFGIGAVDQDPLRGGAIRAYQEGWFTPEAAIKGGAKFVGEKYLHNEHKQNTIYKMRWNPANPGGFRQYASDIGWAVKQVNTIKSLYNQLDNPTLHFDIPKYK